MTDNEETLIQITDDETTDIEETPTVEKTKKSYVMTEARKKALEKGRETRARKVAEKKALKNEEKEISKKNKERQKAMETLGITEDSYNKAFAKKTVIQEEISDEENVVIVKKKKAKPKRIVYETESDDDEPPTVERKRRPAYTDSQVRAILAETDAKAKEVIESKPFRLKRV